MNFAEKLKKIKENLKLWNTSEFGFIDSNIGMLESKIQKIDSIANERDLNPSELENRKSAQLGLWEWLRRKESYWAQNSRTRWIREGDKNTRYFHTLASIRRRKNNIESFQNEGRVIESPTEIIEAANEFFSSLFSEAHQSRATFGGLNFKQLNEEQGLLLTKPFSVEEIDAAVASCDGSKSPGPDGFNFKFVKESWEIIKEDVYAIVHDFWSTSRLPKGCNNAFIALIPKVEVPTGFKDFKPISMVGCVYKIISKLLARRLQQVIGFLIGPHQSSFIKGRQILDGALIAGELID